MPTFVDTKEQSTASMLRGYTSKINLDWSTATSPIDSEIINQSVVTYPIDLENSNWSTENGYQNGFQSVLFDSEKGSENTKNNNHPKKWRITSKKKQHNNADKARHQRKEDKLFLVTTHWVAYDIMRKGWKIIYAN